MPKQNDDIRCCSCNKKLAEAKIKDGYVSIVCKNCGVTNLITAVPEKKGGPEGPEKREYRGNTPN
jgi:phage FluMu protein Com